MLSFNIPGYEQININHLVLDYNGTIAFDGILIQGIESLILDLAKNLEIHVITADTFGTVEKELDHLPVLVTVIPKDNQIEAKKDFISKLSSENVISIGNGRNDQEMLGTSALGILVINQEGASIQSLLKADIICNSIIDDIELLLNKNRLVATLRS